MHWRFGRFQLDCESACLWEGEQRLTLRPKTFDLLVYLVAHAGELVRKETLLQAVWPDTVGYHRRVLRTAIASPVWRGGSLCFYGVIAFSRLS